MRVYQLLDALDFGDAVSTHTIEISSMLTELGYENQIYSLYAHDKTLHLRKSINNIRVKSDDVIIFHFSGKSMLLDKISKLRCKKILIYHNITPHYFFEGMEPHYQHCLEGRQQLQEMVGIFDLHLGDSEFNVQELEELGFENCGVMPIIVDLKIKGYRRKYQVNNDGKKFIFVGRVAPNKKHEDVIKAFDYFCTYIDPKAVLYLVGNYKDYMIYYDKLLSLVATLPSRNNIIFTGKVSSEELDHHYRTADLFLSMSEHEGFCVPLLESMSYGVPTFAYDCGAIRTTMGSSGVLILEKQYENIAELIDILINDGEIMNRIVDNQYDWLDHFSRENAISRLKDILEQARSLE